MNGNHTSALASVHYPENIVLAVLNRIGTQVRIVDGVTLASIFDDAATGYPEFLGDFRWHPQYLDNEVLRETLQKLDLGGEIDRGNMTTTRFNATEHAAGPYGQSKYDALSDTQRKAIDRIAQRIRAESEEGWPRK